MYKAGLKQTLNPPDAHRICCIYIYMYIYLYCYFPLVSSCVEGTGVQVPASCTPLCPQLKLEVLELQSAPVWSPRQSFLLMNIIARGIRANLANPRTRGPADLRTREPVHPRTREPANPRTRQPANPRTRAPANPRTREPANPRTREPANPRTREPANPRTREPCEPANTANP